MKILTEDWVPSDETLRLLKLNGLSDDHIVASMRFIKTKFGGTSIDDIEGYDSWSAFFILFCIKANQVKDH